ncbi:MAG: NADH-quinone oxidoreductase subunit L, partial [Gemmatimonadales bacterium]
LIHVYSVGYMAHDASFRRFFLYLNLFMWAMLTLVLADNFLLMFVGWEGVGLCSYLLIGFWYTRPSAAEAGKKAFIVNRIGDAGFALGMFLLFQQFGTLDFGRIAGAVSGAAVETGWGGTLTIAGILLFIGACGKSAQVPLYVWLPDAMEGPTPVSALIHAATMVTAGVYMVARSSAIYAHAPNALLVVAMVGALTAIFAATIGLVQNDIKRVLAYSTVSQLGYMMAAAGAGEPSAGFAHLFAHGIFKALLFLGAGIVIHVFHTNDVFRMGGLRHHPWIWLPFVVATLALAGVWPLPGFFTKEAILAGVLEGRFRVPFLMLVVTAFLTAFYMFRVVFLAFFARPHHDGHAHHAVPAPMDWVCRLLAALTLALGLRLAFGGHHAEGPPWLPWLSLGVAGAGIGLAWAMYQQGRVDPDRVAAALRPIDWLARRRYLLDAVFAALYRWVLLALARLVGWVDRYLVDGVLNVLSAWTLRAGDRLRRLQTGLPQDYVYGVALGALVLFVLAQWGLR